MLISLQESSIWVYSHFCTWLIIIYLWESSKIQPRMKKWFSQDRGLFKPMLNSNFMISQTLQERVIQHFLDRFVILSLFFCQNIFIYLISILYLISVSYLCLVYVNVIYSVWKFGCPCARDNQTSRWTTKNADVVVRWTTINFYTSAVKLDPIYLVPSTDNQHLGRTTEIVTWLSVGQPFIFP